MQKPYVKLRKYALVLLGLLLISAFNFACSDNVSSNYDPPADHTIKKDGIMHKSGLDEPATNCSGCHGEDLRGGTTGVSCYECHGKEW